MAGFVKPADIIIRVHLWEDGCHLFCTDSYSSGEELYNLLIASFPVLINDDVDSFEEAPVVYMEVHNVSSETFLYGVPSIRFDESEVLFILNDAFFILKDTGEFSPD